MIYRQPLYLHTLIRVLIHNSSGDLQISYITLRNFAQANFRDERKISSLSFLFFFLLLLLLIFFFILVFSPVSYNGRLTDFHVLLK